MPYRSRAQSRLFHAKLARGTMSPATVQEFDQATDFSHLPDKVKTYETKAARAATVRDRTHAVMAKRGYRPPGRPIGT